MTQDQINAFMNEYQALCEKHGMHLESPYDDEIRLYTNDDDFIATATGLYSAELYIEPVRSPRPAGWKPLGMAAASEALKNFYLEGLTNVLNQESEALKKSEAVKKFVKGE